MQITSELCTKTSLTEYMYLNTFEKKNLCRVWLYFMASASARIIKAYSYVLLTPTCYYLQLIYNHERTKYTTNTYNTHITIAEFFIILPHGPNCCIGEGAFRDLVRLKQHKHTINTQCTTLRTHLNTFYIICCRVMSTRRL